MSDWQLGIDFGTSFTVVAVAKDGRVEVVDVESDGRSRLPSAVFLTEDGDVLVGTRALHQAVFAPDRFEPTPKRSIGLGELFLGDGLVDVSDLVAGVFRRVYAETCRQQGGSAPSAVRVTHPADWAESRLNVLRRAVAAAGIENAELVPEPVAAAARIAMSTTQPGQIVAVYDFGGGTFDAAVLVRTPEGFAVAGPPTGRDPLGGEDIDRRIFDHLGMLLADEYPDEWKKLTTPTDVMWRRHAAALRNEIRQAKETLSEVTACQLWVAGIERDVQLTRSELEELIRGDIEDTVDTLAEAITAAGSTPEAVAGIYLVGGSSRIPLVADTIWRKLHVAPTAQENPKSVVAMGAAAWASQPAGRSPAAPPAPPPSAGGTFTAPTFEPPSGTLNAPSPPPPAVSRQPLPAASVGGPFATRLGISLSGPVPVRCSGSVIIDQPGAGRTTVSVWSAPPGADTGGLALRIGEQYRSSDGAYQELSLAPANAFGYPHGLERRYFATGPNGPEMRVDRYLVYGAYSVAGTVSGTREADLDGVALTGLSLDPAAFFAPEISVGTAAGSSVYERIEMTVPGTLRQITATRAALPNLPSLDQWLDHQVAAVAASRPGAMEVSRSAGRIVADLEGKVATLRVPGPTTLLCAIGASDSGGEICEIDVWVPEAERDHLGTMAGRVMLQPTSAVVHNNL